MKPSHHNNLLRVVLGLAFFISNVGLPIVLATCPMTSVDRVESSCCQPQTNQQAVRLSSYSSSSCCEKVVVAKPLKFESTELKATVGTLHKIKIELGSWVENAISTSSRPIVSVGASAGGVLLRSRDSYLLTSSLRI